MNAAYWLYRPQFLVDLSHHIDPLRPSGVVGFVFGGACNFFIHLKDKKTWQSMLISMGAFYMLLMQWTIINDYISGDNDTFLRIILNEQNYKKQPTALDPVPIGVINFILWSVYLLLINLEIYSRVYNIFFKTFMSFVAISSFVGRVFDIPILYFQFGQVKGVTAQGPIYMLMMATIFWIDEYNMYNEVRDDRGQD